MSTVQVDSNNNEGKTLFFFLNHLVVCYDTGTKIYLRKAPACQTTNLPMEQPAFVALLQSTPYSLQTPEPNAAVTKC